MPWVSYFDPLHPNALETQAGFPWSMGQVAQSFDQDGNRALVDFDRNEAGIIIGISVDLPNSSITVFQGSAELVEYTITDPFGTEQSGSLWESPQLYDSTPDIARAPDGSFVVVWSFVDATWFQPSSSTPPVPIPGQRHTYIASFDANGALLIEREISLGTGAQAAVSVDQYGNPALVYFEHDPIGFITGASVQLLNSSLALVGAPIDIFQLSPQLAAYNSTPGIERAPDGSFVVVWSYTDATPPPIPDLGATHTFITSFDANGNLLDQEEILFGQGSIVVAPDGHRATFSFDGVGVVIVANQPPIARPNFYTVTGSDGGTVDNVLINDGDPDLDLLTVVAVNDSSGNVGHTIHAAHGDLTLSANGIFTYSVTNLTGPGGSHLFDVFSYTISDDHGGTDTATLSIRLNRRPNAVDDTAPMATAGVVVLADQAQGVLANDRDPDGDVLSVTGYSGGTHGDLTLNRDGSYRYAVTSVTGPTGEHLHDIFTYTASDGLGGTRRANLDITLNRGPIAANDSARVTTGETASGNVLTNDFDPDGDLLSATSDPSAGTFGRLTLNQDGSYIYTITQDLPEADPMVVGHPHDVFTYTVSDRFGGTATANLTITLNREPVVVDDAATATTGIGGTASGNVLVNDFDPDGDLLSVTGFNGGRYGSLTLHEDGSYSYTLTSLPEPDPMVVGHPHDVFTCTVSDGLGGSSSADLDITLNRAPILLDDVAGVSRGGTISGNVVSNDFDADGDLVEVTSIEDGILGQSLDGTYGTLVLDSDGSYNYTSNPRAGLPRQGPAQDTFTFTESDGHGGTAQATLTITIIPSTLGDVLWRHSDGTVATAAQELGSVPTNWEIEGTGDFDADGDSDILWRHEDGLVVTWELENGQHVENHSVEFAPNGWDIQGLGDFDRDGDDDVLWRHQQGAVVTWEMEDGAYVQNHNIAFASTGWTIQDLGDFDADGDADVIWRHQAGAVVTWEMENGGYVVNHNIAFAATSWRINGTGDFDGDGDADILWRHNEGAVVFWEMQGGEFVTSHSLPDVATTWQIRGTQDFDSDGDADILWRHDDGSVVTWHMEDGALAQTLSFGVVPNAWQIQGTGEFSLL